jgi:serine/threonine-protein kinase HipA
MPLFGAVGDSAPDRWGRTLLRRRERGEARRERRVPQVLRESDFLLGVDDDVRMGNVRFAEKPGGEFLGANRTPLPGPGSLKRLLRAVRAHESDSESRAQSRLLLASGQLLGGSRPKASIRDHDGALWIAKFPSREDERDMQRWEALTLALAADCGLETPAFALATVDGDRVLLLRRFDRDAARGRRLAFVSAFGLLHAQDNEAGNYLAFAEVIRRIGGQPRDDILELWRRALFSVLVSNKDNHLRNHGLVLRESGWRLAPIFDVNPEPQKLAPREFLMSLDGIDDRATLEVALHAAKSFGVTASLARAETRRMARSIARWRERAARLRLPREEIHKMREAFEHSDLEEALRVRSR